jgi:DHA2 family multidrug resistance protein
MQAMGEPTGTALTAMNGMVTQQAALIAYVNDYWLMAVAMVLMFPALLLMGPPAKQASPAERRGAAAME